MYSVSAFCNQVPLSSFTFFLPFYQSFHLQQIYLPIKREMSVCLFVCYLLRRLRTDLHQTWQESRGQARKNEKTQYGQCHQLNGIYYAVLSHRPMKRRNNICYLKWNKQQYVILKDWVRVFGSHQPLGYDSFRGFTYSGSNPFSLVDLVK